MLQVKGDTHCSYMCCENLSLTIFEHICTESHLYHYEH